MKLFNFFLKEYCSLLYCSVLLQLPTADLYYRPDDGYCMLHVIYIHMFTYCMLGKIFIPSSSALVSLTARFTGDPEQLISMGFLPKLSVSTLFVNFSV